MIRRLCATILLVALAGPADASDWGYDGTHGPDHWAAISGDNALCATGAFQSPFNIVPDIAADLPDLDIHYGQVPVAVTNNGHTLMVQGGTEDRIRIGDTNWSLIQFHFHTPSEYLIDGEAFPMEVHFVHQAADGRLAVIGAMIAEGPANPAIAALWTVAPYDPGVTTRGEGTIALRDLLPDRLGYMRFMGSLTTPPCTEGVNWHMLTTPITASADQIAAFRSVFPDNARPIQPRNGRLVVAER